jgi:hypothetical protein
LSFDDISEVLSISNGNSVALSSIKEAANNFTSSNFLSLSGGLVQGPVQINNNLTVFGNITASGTTTFANTVFTTTSSLSVVHLGTGPALYVGNYGNDHIATFVDLQNNLEMLHIGGLSSTFPNVGVKTGNPNKDFTVSGEISATGTIWNGEGNSIQWNKAYDIGTAYQAISSTFLTAETDSQTLTFTESSAELSISNGNTVSLSSLETKETFESVSKNLKSYPYTVNYTDNTLTSIVYSLPDNKFITKMFEYTNSLLTSVSLSGDLPSGIDTTKSLSYTVNNVLTGISYS